MSNFEKTEKIEVVSPKEIVNESPRPLEETSEGTSKDTSEETLEQDSPVLEKLESFLPFFEKAEIVSDTKMVEDIAHCLEKTREFKFENWCKLSLEKREKVLNEVERKIAAIEHRPPLKVELRPLEPNHFGYQCAAENKIVLNSLIVGTNERSMHREVLDTIVHEGRHAYQHYNVDVKTIHESGSEVASWRENFYDPQYSYYRSGEQQVLIVRNGNIEDVDFRLYYYQPVEIDARNFAADVMSQLEERGIVCDKPQ